MPDERLFKRLPKMPVKPAADESKQNLVPTKATLDEVRILLRRYADEVSADVELSQTTKTMYIDFASCFVRWMYGGFKPGTRGGIRRRPRR